MHMNANKSLFDYVLVISLSKGQSSPHLAYSYPPKTEEGKKSVRDDVTQFCYPELDAGTTSDLFKKKTRAETFSFTLTDGDGSKRFGYCRRFYGAEIIECFCIISSFSSFALFQDIFKIVEKRRDAGSGSVKKNNAVFLFLKAVQQTRPPKPGETISVKVLSFDGPGQDTYHFTRTDNEFQILDYVSYKPLFSALKASRIYYLFESLLVERRLIVVSKSVPVLSACINAITAMIFPFVWQHIFIPILPLSLIHYCAAPMPFIVGILSSSLPALSDLEMEEVVIVDLDKGHFLTKVNTDPFLPSSLSGEILQGLKVLSKMKSLESREFSLSVARLFFKFFCTTFSGYTKYFSRSGFDRDSFLKSRSPDVQRFFQSFQTAQSFEMYILEREDMARDNKPIADNCLLTTTNIETLDQKLKSVLEKGEGEIKVKKKKNKRKFLTWKGIRSAPANLSNKMKGRQGNPALGEYTGETESSMSDQAREDAIRNHERQEMAKKEEEKKNKIKADMGRGTASVNVKAKFFQNSSSVPTLLNSAPEYQDRKLMKRNSADSRHVSSAPERNQSIYNTTDNTRSPHPSQRKRTTVTSFSIPKRGNAGRGKRGGRGKNGFGKGRGRGRGSFKKKPKVPPKPSSSKRKPMPPPKPKRLSMNT